MDEIHKAIFEAFKRTYFPTQMTARKEEMINFIMQLRNCTRAQAVAEFNALDIQAQANPEFFQ